MGRCKTKLARRVMSVELVRSFIFQLSGTNKVFNLNGIGDAVLSAFRLAIFAVSFMFFWDHAVVQAHPNHGNEDLSIELIGSWVDQEAPGKFLLIGLRIKNGLSQAVTFSGLYTTQGREIRIYKARSLLGLKSWTASSSMEILPGEEKTLSYPHYLIRTPIEEKKSKMPELKAFFEGLGSIRVFERNE